MLWLSQCQKKCSGYHSTQRNALAGYISAGANATTLLSTTTPSLSSACCFIEQKMTFMTSENKQIAYLYSIMYACFFFPTHSFH